MAWITIREVEPKYQGETRIMKAVTRAITGAARLLQFFLFSGFTIAGSYGAAALAQEKADIQAPEVEVTGNYRTGVGTSDAASAGTVTARRVETRPALRPGELLEYVPGVIVTQHSGDGKANQYFLRGFNLDHGTDFAIDVAGMPVNMPTHAHGQGYADLNFVIPELVERIEVSKGPYAAKDGDFATAGAINLVT